MPTGRRGRSPSDDRRSGRVAAHRLASRPGASSLRGRLAAVALGVMVVLPLAEILLRRFAGTGIPGSIPFVQHLVLWVGLPRRGAGRARGHDAGARDRHVPSSWSRPRLGRYVCRHGCRRGVDDAVRRRVRARDERARGGHRDRCRRHHVDGANGAAVCIRADRAAHGVAERKVAGLPARSRRAAWSPAAGWCGMRPRHFRRASSVAARRDASRRGRLWNSDLRRARRLAIVLSHRRRPGRRRSSSRPTSWRKPTLASIPLFTLCGFLLAEGKAPSGS